jgi:hypothetical protein
MAQQLVAIGQAYLTFDDLGCLQQCANFQQPAEPDGIC